MCWSPDGESLLLRANLFTAMRAWETIFSGVPACAALDDYIDAFGLTGAPAIGTTPEKLEKLRATKAKLRFSGWPWPRRRGTMCGGRKELYE
jgi:hypothetical protein